MIARSVLVLVVAALACGSPSEAQVPLDGTLVVVNKGASTASLIAVGDGKLLATLPTGAGPHEVVTSRDGHIAVVTDYGAGTPGHTLTIIDVRSRQVARTVDMGSLTRPHGIAFLPGDSLVVVTSETTQRVSVVRVADGAVLRELPTGAAGSHMLAVTTDGARIYTGNIPAATVSEIDVAQGTVARTWPVPSQPEAITVSGDGAEVWVGSNDQGLVSVLATSTGVVTTAASGAGRPYRIVLVPGGRLVLVPDLGGEALIVLDRATRAELHRMALAGSGPQGITVTPDGRFAFQALSAQDRVLLIDLDRFETVATYESEGAPDGVAWARP
jgi:DNA-binding beta-propeller fold protein YncE